MRRSRTTRLALAVTALALVGAGTAACGADEESSAPEHAPSSTTPSASGSPQARPSGSSDTSAAAATATRADYRTALVRVMTAAKSADGSTPYTAAGVSCWAKSFTEQVDVEKLRTLGAPDQFGVGGSFSLAGLGLDADGAAASYEEMRRCGIDLHASALESLEGAAARGVPDAEKCLSDKSVSAPAVKQFMLIAFFGLTPEAAGVTGPAEQAVLQSTSACLILG